MFTIEEKKVKKNEWISKKKKDEKYMCFQFSWHPEMRSWGASIRKENDKKWLLNEKPNDGNNCQVFLL